MMFNVQKTRNFHTTPASLEPLYGCLEELVSFPRDNPGQINAYLVMYL
jgi:hypothetical protein